jgi:diamine N-acetyltransferase
MTASDVDLVMDLINELQTYQNFEKSTLTKEILLKDGGFENGQNKLYHVIIAEEQQEVLGYAMYFYLFSTSDGKMMYMEDIYVKNQFRNKKVGRRLLKELSRIAAEQDVPIKLEVLSWNKSSIEFYKKNGAKYLYTKGDDWFGFKFDVETVNKLAED